MKRRRRMLEERSECSLKVLVGRAKERERVVGESEKRSKSATFVKRRLLQFPLSPLSLSVSPFSFSQNRSLSFSFLVHDSPENVNILQPLSFFLSFSPSLSHISSLLSTLFHSLKCFFLSRIPNPAAAESFRSLSLSLPSCAVEDRTQIAKNRKERFFERHTKRF